jgi:hypothetical protein
MLVFSFSKLTIESMKHRCAEYQDCAVFSEQGNIKTIDSFCKYIIDKVEGVELGNTSINVLSSKALELIQTNSELVRKKAFSKRGRYSDIKVLFVDEAQDLNEV